MDGTFPAVFFPTQGFFFLFFCLLFVCFVLNRFVFPVPLSDEVKCTFRNASFFVLEAAALHWEAKSDDTANRNVLLGICMRTLSSSSSYSSDEIARAALSLSHLLRDSSTTEFLFSSGIFEELVNVCRGLAKSSAAVQLACAKLMHVLLDSIEVLEKMFWIFFYRSLF